MSQPEKTGYTFTGITLNGTAVTGDELVTDNHTFEAVWTATEYTATVVRAYATNETVTFTIENKADKLTYIQGLLPTATAEYTYAWATALPSELALASGQEFTIVRTPVEYTVTVDKVEGNDVPVTFTVENRAAKLAEIAAMLEEDTAEWDYEWTNMPTELALENGQTITEGRTKKTYTVKFVDEDGTTVLKSETLEYGATPVAPADPKKAADAQYTYTFAGWDSAISAVTGAATYTATYSSKVNKYVIKFVNADGTELQSTEVEYGTVPTYEGTPTKSHDTRTYVFNGWDKTVVEVTEAATYTATYYVAVATVSDFMNMDMEAGALNKQTAPIDFAGAAINIASFAGEYDGQGYALTGFVTKNIFATLTGTFKNVKLVGTLTGSGTGIVNTNQGTIENVYAELTMDTTSTNKYANGIIGYKNKGYVKNVAVKISETADCLKFCIPFAEMDGYWNTTYVNNVYVQFETTDSVVTASPQIVPNGWDKLEKNNTTVKYFDSVNAFIEAVQAAVEAETLPAMFKVEKVGYTVKINADGVDVTASYADQLAVLGEMKAYVGMTVDLTELATAATPEGYKLMNTSVLSGVVTKEGLALVINYEELTETFEYGAENVDLVVKEYNGQDYGNVKTYSEFTSSVGAENYTYETSNADVATVANGVVTAVGNGTATITVKYDDKEITKLTVNVAVWNAVDSVATLKAVAGEGKYFQVADIDFSSEEDKSINVASFAGEYDGMGKSITGFVTKNVIATLTGTFKNVKLVGTLTNASGDRAGIVNANKGKIENIYAEITMSIAGKTAWNSQWTNGIVAWENSGYMTNIAVIVKEAEGCTMYAGPFAEGQTAWDTTYVNNVYLCTENLAKMSWAAIAARDYAALYSANTTVKNCATIADFTTAVAENSALAGFLPQA